MLNLLVRRSAALLSTGALAAAALGTASPARAEVSPTDLRPLTIAASWLSSLLEDGHLPVEDMESVPRYDASITLAQSLIAVGGHDGEVAAITADVAEHIDDAVGQDYYWRDTSTGDSSRHTWHSASWTAAALVLARSLPSPTSTLGGLDLRERLEGLIATSPSGAAYDKLWVEGVPATPSFSSAVREQATVVQALALSGSAKAPAATEILLDQQCTNGAFPAIYHAYAPTPPCADGPDTRTTAVALRVLAGLPAPSPAVTAAVTAAATWLDARQQADGSFTDDFLNGKPYPTVTTEAALALDAVGRTGSARRAAAWLRTLQIDDVAGCPSSGAARGSIDVSRLIGPSDDPWIGESARRIFTAAALPALALAPPALAPLTLTAARGYHRGGSKVTYYVDGLAPGASACLSAFGVRHALNAGADGGAVLALKVPATTSTYAITVTDVDGPVATVRTQVLGAKKLIVQAPTKVRKGKKAKVVVRGLRPREKVTLRYAGARVSSGYASAKGTYVATIRVGTKRGAKVVRAYGQFANRAGADTIKVVR